ncbi:MAG: helix-turn-helix domain-containing protein [Nocardioidaceae bacterium]
MPAAVETAQLKVAAPHPALVDHVQSLHGYDYRPPAGSIHHGLPSRSLTMVIALEDPIELGWLGAVDNSRAYQMAVSGLHTAPAAILERGRPQRGIELELTTLGARELLGLPASELSTTMIHLDDLLGPLAPELYDDVAAAPGWQARFAVLNRHLLRLVRRDAGSRAVPSPELVWGWRRLSASDGAVRVRAVADEVGWSRRHFSTMFRAEFGIGPKQAARIMRFERSKQLVAADQVTGLAEVAVECGYADQAHLTREWRELAGYSPRQWRREELPFLQDEVPLG